MTTSDARIEVVTTGAGGNGPNGTVYLVACAQCGALLWNVDKHYASTHADEKSAD